MFCSVAANPQTIPRNPEQLVFVKFLPVRGGGWGTLEERRKRRVTSCICPTSSGISGSHGAGSRGNDPDVVAEAVQGSFVLGQEIAV